MWNLLPTWTPPDVSTTSFSTLVQSYVRWTVHEKTDWISFRYASAYDGILYATCFLLLAAFLQPLIQKASSFLVWELMIPYSATEGGFLVRKTFQFPLWVLDRLAQGLISIVATLFVISCVLGLAYTYHIVESPFSSLPGIPGWLKL